MRRLSNSFYDSNGMVFDVILKKKKELNLLPGRNTGNVQ